MNPHQPGRRRGRLAGRAALLMALALPAGCGENDATLTGRVLYNGRPVTGGWLTFRPADGRKNTRTVLIDENGIYAAPLPAGEVRIAVDNREWERPAARAAAGVTPALPTGLKLPPGVNAPPPGRLKPAESGRAPEDGPPKHRGTYVAIPKKYYDVDTSGLAHTVKSGSHPYDIELK
jgi:hypothetical protein